MLLPLENTGLRRAVEDWFEAEGIRPRVVAEFQDTAMAKAFGEAGLGVFASPSVVDAHVLAHYKVKLVGRVRKPVTRFYAVSVERRFKHPGVLAILDAARKEIFSETRVEDV